MSRGMVVEQVAAARAAVYRANRRFIVIGVFAAEVSTLFVAFALVLSAQNVGFWAYFVAMQVVLVSTLTLFVAESRIHPPDAELVSRWIPMADVIALAFNLLIVISPWVVLPIATPTVALVIYLTYAWYLMLTLSGSITANSGVNMLLIAMPVSLAACLLVHDLPMAIPISGFFVLAGLTLLLIERSRQHARANVPAEQLPDASLEVAVDPAVDPPPSQMSSPAQLHPTLTPRQDEVLRQVGRGLTNKEIARELGISPATVKAHLAQILATTGSSNRIKAAISQQAAHAGQAEHLSK